MPPFTRASAAAESVRFSSPSSIGFSGNVRFAVDAVGE
jgi:hypothetical protein